MASLQLYSYKESGNSYKVRLLLSILGVPYETVELDFLADEQHGPRFLALNPRGEVPTLVVERSAAGKEPLVLRDSAAILTYVGGTYGKEKGWWSADVEEQALIVEWLAFAASWVQYGVFTARAIKSFGGPYNGLGTSSTDQTLQEATIRSHKSLEILNQALANTNWLALGRPTIADLAVFVYIALAPMGDIDLQPYANVTAWIERVKKLDGFISIPGLDDPLYRRR